MRPSWHAPVADAVMTHWLGGINDEDRDTASWLATWWETPEATDAAMDLVDVVSAAIENEDHCVVRRGVHTRAQTLASILRLVWPDVRTSWEGLGPTDDADIVAQMVTDGTLADADAEVLLEVLWERS